MILLFSPFKECFTHVLISVAVVWINLKSLAEVAQSLGQMISVCVPVKIKQQFKNKDISCLYQDLGKISRKSHVGEDNQ